MKKKFISILMIAISLMIFAACGTSGETSKEINTNSGGEVDTQEASDDLIRVGLDVDAGTLDPRLSNDTTASRVNEIVYNGLVKLDTDLAPQPDLAESWENPDDVTYIFYLREDVTFHDGEPFTAEDVKYTFDTILDEGFNAPHRSLYAPIKSIEVIDEHTVQFNMEEAYAPLLSYLDIGIVPKHLADDEDFGNNPVGTGPYKMVEWNRDNKITFEANEDYYEGAPKTANIEYYIIPDNVTRVSALEAGDIDFLQSPVSAQDIERIESDDRFKVHKETALGYTYLNFNFEDELIQNDAIRQAIALSVNKESISEDIYEGMDSPGNSPILPSSWAFTEGAVKDYDYDLDKAMQVLEDDGWVDNGTGVREKNGQALELTLITHTEDPNRMQVVEFLQYELQAVGFDVTVETKEWPSFQEELENGEHQVALLGWLNIVDPDRGMYKQLHAEGGSNYGSYDNPKVNELLDAGRQELDQEKRKDIYIEAAQIVTEDVAYDVILYQGHIAMHVKELEGLTIHPGAKLNSLKDATISH